MQAKLLVLERIETERQMAGGFAHEVRNALAGPQTLIAQVLGKTDEGKSAGLPRQNAGKLQELYALFQPSASSAQLVQLKDILREVFENEEHLDDVLRVVRRSVTRALHITQQILDYARTGEDRTPRTLVDVNRVVRALAGDMEAQLRERNVRLEARLDPSTPHIDGHEMSLHSVVENLVFNASDALVEVDGGRERHITVTTDHADGVTRIAVSDNGVGIAPENLARIFEPFFSTKPQTGTGLGLALVKKVVSLAGGKIEVESRVGEGTRVALLFPEPGGDPDQSGHRHP